MRIHSFILSAVVFLSLATISNTAVFAQEGITPTGANQQLQQPQSNELATSSDYTPGQFWLAVSVIILMAFLFMLLFYWQQQGEQAGYFSRIYRDTVRNIELDRLAVPIDEKWTNKSYLNELLRESSERARAWLAVAGNKRPEPDGRLEELAQKLKLEFDLREMSDELPWLLERRVSEESGDNENAGIERLG